jgi:16S rRNA processing protein RimM
LWIDVDTELSPDEPNAWYDHQLVGLTVLREGAPVGTVSRVDHFPAQDLLVVATDAGEVMVPFVAAIVPSVDIANRTVTITPPGGLFEQLPDDEEAASDAD